MSPSPLLPSKSSYGSRIVILRFRLGVLNQVDNQGSNCHANARSKHRGRSNQCSLGHMEHVLSGAISLVTFFKYPSRLSAFKIRFAIHQGMPHPTQRAVSSKLRSRSRACTRSPQLLGSLSDCSVSEANELGVGVGLDLPSDKAVVQRPARCATRHPA